MTNRTLKHTRAFKIVNIHMITFLNFSEVINNGINKPAKVRKGKIAKVTKKIISQLPRCPSKVLKIISINVTGEIIPFVVKVRKDIADNVIAANI